MSQDEMLFRLPAGVDPRGPEELGSWIDCCKARLKAWTWLRGHSAIYKERARQLQKVNRVAVMYGTVGDFVRSKTAVEAELVKQNFRETEARIVASWSDVERSLFTNLDRYRK